MRRLLPIALAAALAAPAGAAAAPDPLRGEQWNLDMVESDAAHGVATGGGAVVAVIDTGVLESHEDLQGRLLPGRDFVQEDAVPQDGDGHGTHVAGIVAANDGNGVGISSVAPGAAVLPLRVLGDDGSGDVHDVARAMDHAVAQGAQVINLSLGGEIPLVTGSDEFDAALDRALDAGVVVVAASGNSSFPVCDQPSAEGRLLCVGSVDRRGVRSSFSNFGMGLGVVAPGGSGLPIRGEDILSTYPGPRKYEEVAGTSQATPHVAGVAALLVSRGLRGQAVAQRILDTARDAGAPGEDPEYGAGIVNARAAVAGLPAPAPGPTPKVSVTRVQRISPVIRKGIRIRCRPVADGRCTATVTARGTTLAHGSTRARAGQTVTVTARVTKRGRKVLRRVSRSLSARAYVALPGSPTAKRKLTLRR